MIGLFLKYGSIIDEKQADEFLKFCVDSGITDAFVQTGVINWGSRVDMIPDMFSYIVKNRGKLNIHAHITTLRLWREKYYLPPELRPEIEGDPLGKGLTVDGWLWLNDAHKWMNPNEPAYWCLNPLLKGVQDYLVETCKTIIAENDIQGLYLERLYFHPSKAGEKLGTYDERKQSLTTILDSITTDCKKIKPELKISVSTFQFSSEYLTQKLQDVKAITVYSSIDYDRLQDLPTWENIVDYLMPMIYREGTLGFDSCYNVVKDNPKYIPVLACYKNDPAETQRQIAEIGIKNYALFRYGKMTPNA